MVKVTPNIKLSSIPTASNYKKQDTVDEDETCGCRLYLCGSEKLIPIRFLQRFAKPRWALALFSCVGFIQGFAVTGLTNVVLTTIQKRFSLSSEDAGLIPSFYNIASCIVIPFVSYVGGRGTKPLWIGGGMAILGVGCIFFALPHFIIESVQAEKEESNLLCPSGNQTIPEVTNFNYFKYLFFLAHALNGIGVSALITLGMAYLDENVEQKYSSVYHGIYFAVAAGFGPASGYVIGGATLQIFTDLSNSPGISYNDSSWIGAWWLGYLCCGFLLILLSVPISLLPRRMSPFKHRRPEIKAVSESAPSFVSIFTESNVEFGERLKDIPASAFQLLTNIPFMLVAIPNALDFGLVSGFSIFSPKYIESLFGLRPSQVAYYLGVIVFVGGFLGYLIGGIVVSKAQLSIRGMIKFCCCNTCISFAFGLIYLRSCDDVVFAGVTTPYVGQSLDVHRDNFNAECNANCNCIRDFYAPVCGANGVVYFSPCYAGCRTKSNKTFLDCDCIPGNTTLRIATSGLCENSKCEVFGVYMFCLFGVLFFTILNWTPVFQIVIRVVPFNQRSFALGALWLFNRSLGGIPSPIVFGRIVDLSCAVWSEEERGEGSCLNYFNRSTSRFFLYIVVVQKIIILIFYTLAAFFTKSDDRNVVHKRKAKSSKTTSVKK